MVIKRIYAKHMPWLECQQRGRHSSSEFIKVMVATRLYMDTMHGMKRSDKFKQQNRRNYAQQCTEIGMNIIQK